MRQGRRLGSKPGEAPRIVILDDSRLMYSDDYRWGWKWGFKAIGCEVKTIDIAELRKGLSHGGGGGPLTFHRPARIGPAER